MEDLSYYYTPPELPTDNVPVSVTGNIFKQCGTCHWWRPFDQDKLGGQCHRMPPFDTGWPVTEPQDFCGEHTTKL